MTEPRHTANRLPVTVSALAPCSVSYVQQQDRSGCGIACVAMLTGLDYATVRAAWVGYSKRREFQLIAGGNGAGMTTGEINALLIRLGGSTVQASIRRVPVLYRGRPFGGHFVVVDENGKTYDPDDSPNVEMTHAHPNHPASPERSPGSRPAGPV